MASIQYRVREVTRYIVTRYTQDSPNENGSCGASSESIGEFLSKAAASSVAEAMVVADQSRGLNAELKISEHLG